MHVTKNNSVEIKLSAVFTGKPRPGFNKAALSKNLLALCGGASEKANGLYRKSPVQVAKNLTANQAQQVVKKFWLSGWHVDLYHDKRKVYSTLSKSSTVDANRHASSAAMLARPLTPQPAPNRSQTVRLRRIHSNDRHISLCLPLSWQLKSQLNADAVLQAGDDSTDSYLIVIPQAKHTFGAVVGLKDYTNAIVNAALGWVDESLVTSQPRLHEKGRYFSAEITGSVGSIPVKYHISVHESKKSFFVTYLWSNLAHFNVISPLVGAIGGSFKVSDIEPSRNIKRTAN